jgi:acetyl esterase/lipase
VFKSASPTGDESRRRPLHLDVHGGGFIGGLPESDAAFCARLARETGAVVISTTYRYAPKHTFPAAIDDVDAVVAYLRQHAGERYNADPSLMTVSGFSAGGNLALATALSVPAGDIKAAVTFYAVVDQRLSPAEKPKPAGFPAKDPLAFLLPLFDSYPAPSRPENMNNPRLSPIVADIETLPESILMVVPGVDILVHEQLTFIQRLKKEGGRDAKGAERRFQTLYDEKGFHGYLEGEYAA